MVKNTHSLCGVWSQERYSQHLNSTVWAGTRRQGTGRFLLERCTHRVTCAFFNSEIGTYETSVTTEREINRPISCLPQFHISAAQSPRFADFSYPSDSDCCCLKSMSIHPAINPRLLMQRSRIHAYRCAQWDHLDPLSSRGYWSSPPPTKPRSWNPSCEVAAHRGYPDFLVAHCQCTTCHARCAITLEAHTEQYTLNPCALLVRHGTATIFALLCKHK